MSDLRSKLIRLAHEHPEFREHLLPLVKKASRQLNRKEQQRITQHLMGGGVDEWDVNLEIEHATGGALMRPASVILLKTDCEEDAEGNPTDVEVLAEIRTEFRLKTRGAKVEMVVTFPFYWEDWEELV